MKFELKASLARQKENPHFLIPLIFDGNFPTSMPSTMDGEDISSTFRNILALDFTNCESDFDKYVHQMSSCSPLGLIPTICHLEDNEDYERTLHTLQLQLNVIRGFK